MPKSVRAGIASSSLLLAVSFGHLFCVTGWEHGWGSNHDPRPRRQWEGKVNTKLTESQQAERYVEVLRLNSESLRQVINATACLFGKHFDVAGDDDMAIISLKYEDWTHLLQTMEPFFPNEVAAINKRVFREPRP